MKKRICSLLLAVSLAFSVLVVPAAAVEAGRFSDVNDRSTETAVEVLRLMGVLDGYGDGTFRPTAQLNRAQFCKMAVHAMDAASLLGQYRTVTVFPDVRPSHWAAPYVNMAAKGLGIISGYADGYFHPERTVTMGQAVTILLRMLGYKDEAIGGIWPDSYLAVAQTIGLTEGINASGASPLTRQQAAQLFLNLLDTERAEGGTLYTLSKETVLLGVDGGTGVMKTADGSYRMVRPVSATTLTGASGRAVLNQDGKALTFLPSSVGASVMAGAAVVVHSDRSSAGFRDLAGSETYALYKNGAPATLGDIRQGDVAVYNAATNAILLCDTRVTVYYENCTPSPDAPVRIKAFGREFNVLPSAMDAVAKYTPGDTMTLLLTADGQVAGVADKSGAAAYRSNALAVVNEGTVQMLCGNTLIPLEGVTAEEEEIYVARIVGMTDGTVSLSRQSNALDGDLNVTQATLDGKPIADNAIILDGSSQLTLLQLTQDVIPESQIVYGRANWAGEVDFIVMDRGSSEIYGRVFMESEEMVDKNGKYPGEEGYIPTTRNLVGVETGPDSRIGPLGSRSGIKNGAFVSAKLNQAGTAFISMKTLTVLENVRQSAWVGKETVTFGGRSYSVAADLLCYNTDAGTWITLDEARMYSDAVNLHVKDGVVRIVTVGRR